jgi:hypothetical protein
VVANWVGRHLWKFVKKESATKHTLWVLEYRQNNQNSLFGCVPDDYVMRPLSHHFVRHVPRKIVISSSWMI